MGRRRRGRRTAPRRPAGRPGRAPRGARGAGAFHRAPPLERPAPSARARAGRRPRRRSASAGAPARPPARRATRPGRGESTTIRSASSTASSTSWVTSTTVRGSALSAAASQPCISRRVIASSAPNGSSRHSTGLPDSSVRSEGDALAHATRQLVRAAPPRSPPARARRTGRRSARARAARQPAEAQRQRGVVERAQPRQQQVALGHQGGGLAAHRAPVGLLQAADQLQQRRLAAPAGADHGDHLAGAARRFTSSAVTARAAGSPCTRRRRSDLTLARPSPARAAAARGARVRWHVAPSAGITPQVRRVGAGRRFVGAISAGLRQPPWCWLGGMLARGCAGPPPGASEGGPAEAPEARARRRRKARALLRFPQTAMSHQVPDRLREWS